MATSPYEDYSTETTLPFDGYYNSAFCNNQISFDCVFHIFQDEKNQLMVSFGWLIQVSTFIVMNSLNITLL